MLADLHAFYRGIEGAKARARLIVGWPGIDNDIAITGKRCSKGEFDRPSNVKEQMQHLLVRTHAFHIISADWSDLNGKKFFVFEDWYLGYFDVKGSVPNPNTASLISCLREWFINTAVCDLPWSDGGSPFGSTEVNNFLARWCVEWCPSYPQGNSFAESALKWAKGLLRKCWRGRGKPFRINEKWVKGIFQWKNTPHKSTGLSPAIMLYGHSVQDAIPCHKSSLS